MNNSNDRFWINKEFKYFKVDENSDFIKSFSKLSLSFENNEQYQNQCRKRDFELCEKTKNEHELSGHTNPLGVYSFTTPTDEIELSEEYIDFLKRNHICEILTKIKNCLDNIFKDFLILDQIYAKNERNKTVPKEKLYKNSILTHPLFYEYYCLLINNIYINIYKVFENKIYPNGDDAHLKALMQKINVVELNNTKIKIHFTNADKTERVTEIEYFFTNIKAYLAKIEEELIKKYIHKNIHDWATKIEKHLTLESITESLPPIKDLFNLFTVTYLKIYPQIAKALFFTSWSWKLNNKQIIKLFGSENNYYHISASVCYVGLDGWIKNIDEVWTKGNHAAWLELNQNNLILMILDRDDAHIIRHTDLYPKLNEKYKFNVKEFLPLNNDNFLKLKVRVKKCLDEIILNNDLKDNIDVAHIIIDWLSKN